MSLITQCPACSTMFRVVPDQLRISEGWVRCGQCDEVFDANAHLQASTPLPTAPAAAAVAPAPQTPVGEPPLPADSPVPANTTYDWGVLDERDAAELEQDPLEDVLQPAAGAEPPDFSALEGVPAHDSLDVDYRVEVDPLLAQSPQHTAFAEESVAEQVVASPLSFKAVRQESPHARFTDSLAGALPDEEPPSFMREAQHPAQGDNKSGKWMWLVASIFFTVALALQVIYVERNLIKAAIPAAGPALQGACDVVGCTISAPRRIESISIDSSAFNSIKSGVYVLRVTLKNASTLALESPALELTLTDMQDRPLLKRVIQRAEYADRDTTIAASAELALNVPVSVHIGAELEKIAGYKLLAFYP